MKINVNALPKIGYINAPLKTQKLFSDLRKDSGLLIRVIILSIMTIGLLAGCNEDDQGPPKEPWQQELELLRSAIAPYSSLDQAVAAGYDDEFTGYRSQMGYHYLKASLLDNTFELTQPEVLMFAPDLNGNLQFVGVEYAVPIANMDNPPPAPEGFTGDVDEWAINTEFNVWTLHVWVGIDNPHGIFYPHNPTLP